MADIMNPVTKKAYKIEFETTNITIDELYEKYNITAQDLGSTASWEKRASVTLSKEEAFKQKIKPELSPEAEANSSPKAAPVKRTTPSKLVVDGEDDMLASIQETKALVLTSTKQFFEDYTASDVTTKEFKDMVGVLKDMEMSELTRQGKNTGPTVNILIQNLTEKFKDDC